MIDIQKPTRQQLSILSDDQRLIKAIELLFDAVIELQAIAADLEARVTALEP